MRHLSSRFFFICIFIFSSHSFAQTFTRHFVETGETLTILAKEYEVTIEDILFANKDILDNENELKLGMILKIPEKTSYSTNQKQNYPYGTLHLIKTGEYLSSIAQQYEGVKIGDIMKYNNISNVEITIQRGRLLLIPPPNGNPIRWDKIENLELLEMVGNIDNPYLMPEYMEYLLPEGEDPLHDLAYDYFEENQDNQGKILTEKENTLKEKPLIEKEITKKEETKRVLRGEEKKTATSKPLQKETKTSILQTGIAIKIEEENQKKYLWVKHKTAPIGTVIWVKNPLNNKRVRARVIENLPAEKEALVAISSMVIESLELKTFPCNIQTKYQP